MKTQTQVLDNGLYYRRKIELHRKGKESCTVRITPIVICPSDSEISVLITVRRVHYSKMGKVPTTVFISLGTLHLALTFSCMHSPAASLWAVTKFSYSLF